MRHLLTLTTALFTASIGLAQTAPPAAPATTAPPATTAAPDAAAVAVAPAAAAAPAAEPAVAVAPATPAPPPLPTDRRERVQAVCMAEANAKAKAAGVTEVRLKDVEDTDLKSDGFASMRAKIELVSIDSKGKTKKKKGTFGCSTKNDVVTNFKFD